MRNCSGTVLDPHHLRESPAALRARMLCCTVWQQPCWARLQRFLRTQTLPLPRLGMSPSNADVCGQVRMRKRKHYLRLARCVSRSHSSPVLSSCCSLLAIATPPDTVSIVRAEWVGVFKSR